MINLDADEPSTAIANLVKAKKKYGFYMDKYGHPVAFNKEAEYFLDMQFSDVIKKKNKKSSQELFFDIACLPYKKQEYMFRVSDESKKYADEFKKRHKLRRNVVGLNMASGKRWPSKRPSTRIIVDLAKKLQKKGYNLLILGGPEEKDFYEFLKNKLHENGVKFTINNLNNSIKEFIGVVSICDKVITTDSLAMHIAIALNKETTALFYCTPSWEIENYGKVNKITSKLLEKYFYTDEYIEELVNSISADEMLKEF